MTTPSAFEIAKQVGTNLAPMQERAADRSAIDEILQNSAASGDPRAIDNAIGQILSRVSPQSQAGALQILQGEKQRILKGREREAYKKYGLDESIADLPEHVQKEIIKSKIGQTQKKNDEKENLEYAFNRIEELMETGHTGVSYGRFTPQGREDRAELDTLSEMFIGALIPILNPRGVISKPRFDYIKSLAPRSTDYNSEIRGKLKALKKIFKLGSDGSLINASPEQITEIINTPDETEVESVSTQNKKQGLSQFWK